MRVLHSIAIWTLVGCGPAKNGTGDAQPAAEWSDAATCGSQTVPIAVTSLGVPPDLLIVLDRSGSMRLPLVTLPIDLTPRWTIMADALDQLATMAQNNIRYGVLEFPTDTGCAVDPATAVRVPIGLGNAPAIASYLATRVPDTGETPALTALEVARSYYASIPINPAGRYVLFATDGDPNCTASPVTGSVAAVTTLAADGIKTFVLGFGGQFSTSTLLEDAAIAGEEPRPNGPPHYYDAKNAADLHAALAQIAGGIIVPSCTYQLASAPPDPNDVTVELGATPVPRSTMHTDGWDYYPDAMTITLFGTYCDQIMGGGAVDVSFLYGCPGQVID